MGGATLLFKISLRILMSGLTEHRTFLMLLLQLLYLKLDMRAVEEAVNLLPRC